jgi:hypothetical protein
MDLLTTDTGNAADAVSWAREASLLEVDEALVSAAAAIAAGQARLAQVFAVFVERGGHERAGMASPGQWGSINLGQSARSCASLAATGAAVADLPSVRQAWEAGELSTDKARLVASVADAGSDARWAVIAAEASATQLARIVSTYRRTTDADDEGDARDRQERCGLSWHTRSDGLEELLVVLEPADAALVRAALDAGCEREWRSRRAASAKASEIDDDSPAVDVDDEPVVPIAHRRLDALLDVCESALATGPRPLTGGDRTQVTLEVDAAFLAGDHEVGRSTGGHGHTVDRDTAQCLSCDALIRPLVRDADGRAVDLGRAHRLVSDKQRRLLAHRDRGCRFPGCVNDRFVDAHHVVHWADGGRTDMANLLLLCRRHHRQHHKGLFHIAADGDGGFSFSDAWGRELGPPRRIGPPGVVPSPVDGSVRARSGGDPRYSVDLTVASLAS